MQFKEVSGVLRRQIKQVSIGLNLSLPGQLPIPTAEPFCKEVSTILTYKSFFKLVAP